MKKKRLQPNVPNKITIRAIKESYDEKKLIRSKNIKDFLKKLGL